MKNSKAFTLVELIAVLVILSLLTLIAVPSINYLVTRNKNKSFSTKMDVIIRQAKQYAHDNESFLYESTKKYKGYVCNTITVGELKTLGYLEEIDKETGNNTIKDPRNNQSMENYTIMLYIKNDTTGGDNNKYAGTIVGIAKDIDNCKSGGDIFVYTGKEEVFTAPVAGTYKVEAWGAQGGSANKIYSGGYGGYSYGEIALAQNEKLYINVGGEGRVTLQANVTELGGYNGGGIAVNGQADSQSINVGSGGGATSVTLQSGLLRDFENNVENVVIVAGGGGGGKYYDGNYHGAGGNGGGYIGGDATKLGRDVYGKGATQTAGGCRSDNVNCGSFGKANMPGSLTQAAGGGGGYYGGGAGGYGAGGGSGYIGNSRLTNKGMYCYNCSESSEESTKTTTTTCHDASAKENCAKAGAGAVRISRI